MQHMRKHKRFKLDVSDLRSNMSIVGKVDIIDISAGGVALKADRKLNMGKECLMTLGYDKKHITIKGIVVRSELSGVEERADGEKVNIYSVGILFNNESVGKATDFLGSTEDNKKARVPEQAGWFYRCVRFFITTPSGKVLSLPSQFIIREISQSGIIIQMNHQLNVDSMILMELSFDARDAVSFMGKVVFCRMIQDQVNTNYDIGIEFLDLTDRDRSLILSFMGVVKDKGDTDNCVTIIAR